VPQLKKLPGLQNEQLAPSGESDLKRLTESGVSTKNSSKPEGEALSLLRSNSTMFGLMPPRLPDRLT
jgi:hypothetical protein